MPRYRRARVPGGTYFFTVATERRQPLLIHTDVRTALRKAIVHVRETLPFRMMAGFCCRIICMPSDPYPRVMPISPPASG